MTGVLIMSIMLAYPLALGMLFRVQTAHIFFSLMAGELLGRYFGHEVEQQAANLSQKSILHGIGEISLLAIPMLLTAVFLRGTVTKGRILLHVIPLAVTGIVFAAFLLPLLPATLQSEVSTNTIGSKLLQGNRYVIGGVIVLQLIYLWFLGKKDKSHSNHHSH